MRESVRLAPSSYTASNPCSPPPAPGKKPCCHGGRRVIIRDFHFSLSQCILTNQLAPREEVRSATRPTCFSLTSEQQEDPSLSPVLILTIPVKISLARKVRNISGWQTCKTDKLINQLLDGVPVTPVKLSQDQGKAQTTLAKHIINQDLQLELYFNTDLVQAPNMFEVNTSYINPTFLSSNSVFFLHILGLGHFYPGGQ